jgi:hypothetical protein
MPRAKKTSDSSAARGNFRAKKVPFTQSPDLNPSTSAAEPAKEEQVRRRAYELFLQRGGFWGNPEQDWFQAEAEVRDRHIS